MSMKQTFWELLWLPLGNRAKGLVVRFGANEIVSFTLGLETVYSRGAFHDFAFEVWLLYCYFHRNRINVVSHIVIMKCKSVSKLPDIFH